MSIEAAKPSVSSWRSPLERDPFVDAAHVANGIHSPRPLSRELYSDVEVKTISDSVRVLELGAVTLDASTHSLES